ncbi:MAG: alpha/beta hydrolase, partial [Myxococcales bacterium]
MARHALRTLLFALLLAACAEGTGDAAPDASDGPADAGFVDGGTGAGDAGRFDAGAVDAGGTDAGAADGGAGDAGLGPARVVVHYDVGFGRRITLRGSAAPLSWTAGYETTWTEGNQWVATLDVAEPVELKPLIDDTKWAEGPNWKVAPGQTVDVWPYFNHTAGAVTKWIDWSNPSLGNTRPVWVYTPPSYSENAAQRYPVVYMHDGQNLFYDSMAFGGTSWNVQGAMDKGIADGTIREALVIGVGNTSARINEYTPVEDSRYAGSGKGDVYLQAVISDLKPKVDAAFRTQAGPANTAIAGSSLGGLISSHAGNK